MQLQVGHGWARAPNCWGWSGLQQGKAARVQCLHHADGQVYCIRTVYKRTRREVSVTCFAIPQVPALDHKNTLVFLNKFITHTTQFLNKFSTVCEEVGPYTKGSHTHLACRSICSQDQNGIKQSTFFIGADQGIKTNSEWLILTDRHTFSNTKEVWQCFCPLNSCKIMQSRASEQSNQAIKDDFHQSRFLILVANAYTDDSYVATHRYIIIQLMSLP